MSNETKTQVFFDQFKGEPIFAVWKVDDSGEKVGKYPIVSFGKGKGLEILKHFEELSKWCDGSK